MPSSNLSFDRAVTYYDRSRDLPEPIATHGLAAISNLLGTGLTLDVGTGSGRISVPLLERGANLMGCDLSLKMMQLLRDKHPAARLGQAEAARLPFPTGTFEAVMTIHVLHVVGAWQAALREFRRVLKPDGVYLNSWNWHHPQAPQARLRDYWRSRVEAHGGEWRRPGIQNREELLTELRAMGAQVQELEVVRFSSPVNLERDVIEALANRLYSDTWQVPEPILQQSIQDLRQWAQQEYPNLQADYEEERLFILDVARFTPSPPS